MLQRPSICYVFETSQELRMLSSVTINCQVTKIVIKPGSQLTIVSTVISVTNVTSPHDCSIREHPKCHFITADQMSQLSQVSRVAP